MKLQMVQNALKQKNIKYEYTEEDDCGSLDFMFRGLRFHVWEYHDEVWGAETNIYEAGRSQDIEGDYEKEIAWKCVNFAWNLRVLQLIRSDGWYTGARC